MIRRLSPVRRRRRGDRSMVLSPSTWATACSSISAIRERMRTMPSAAVRAGLAVVDAVARLRSQIARTLQARVGIATGLVVVGDLIGRGEAQERGVVGETPNLAARHAGAGAARRRRHRRGHKAARSASCSSCAISARSRSSDRTGGKPAGAADHDLPPGIPAGVERAAAGRSADVEPARPTQRRGDGRPHRRQSANCRMCWWRRSSSAPDGVPLFVEELTRAVIEAGYTRRRGAVGRDAAAVLLPCRRHRTPRWIARLDRLGPAAREIAQVGAVLGREFPYELIGTRGAAADGGRSASGARRADRCRPVVLPRCWGRDPRICSSTR